MSKKASVRDISVVIGVVGGLLLWFWAVVRYDFLYWWMLFGLLTLIPAAFFLLKKTTTPTIKATFPSGIEDRLNERMAWLLELPKGLVLLLLSTFWLLAAAPIKPDEVEESEREGIDIMIVMDASLSMLAKDFEPNRLKVAKRVAQEFVEERPNDRFGLVIYEAESFTQVPLTTDHRVMIEALGNVETDMLEGGTAIGMGLASAVNSLRQSESESKVVILLTDGVNNSGSIEPTDAARLAQSFGIFVHTIGVGSTQSALSPVGRDSEGRIRYDYIQVNIDEATLKEIAETTNGSYSRATTGRNLKNIFEKIDNLETTRFSGSKLNRNEHAYVPLSLFAGFILLLLLLWKFNFIRTTP